MPEHKTKAERRRIGRAIRKQRRLEREAAASTRWTEVFEVVSRAVNAVGELFTRVALAVEAIDWSSVIAEWERLYAIGKAERERARRDWMLTYRALPAGAGDE